MTGDSSGEAGRLLVMTADHVVNRFLAAIISKYLFAAGKAGFARGQFHSSDASIFDELISNVERWSVAGHGQIRADAK